MMLRTYLLLLFLLFSSSFLQGQSSPPTEVVAREGDGIYTILRKNGLDPAQYFKHFLEMNKGSIGKDSSLYIGRTYYLPPNTTSNEPLVSGTGEQPSVAASKTEPKSETKPESTNKPKAGPTFIDYPLFGKNYSRVEIKDNQLKGAVYYLSSGHGGPDPGAIGKYGPYNLGEDEYAYDVTIRIARRLMEHGATVYMIIQDPDDGIRDTPILELDVDERCYPNLPIPVNQKERLRQRTNAINDLYIQHKGAYQRMLAIHVDSRSKGENIDVFFYHHENSPSGKKLAENIHKTITSKYNRHQPNRNYFGNVTHRSSLYVVKYSHPPAVFIELGNIRNDRDQRRFVLPDNRQALANWISEGIISDYKSR